MTLNDRRLYQAFKYATYAFLTLNIFLFFQEEWGALQHRFTAGIAPSEIIEGFASTIDTAAWVVLLLMFELETYVLDDRNMTRAVARTLQTARVFCYAVITYAFVGYLTKLGFLQQASLLAQPGGLCALAAESWSYAVDLDEYVVLTADNCGALSRGDRLVRFMGLDAVVDAAGYVDILRLAWVDVINSGTWLAVVAALEAEVQLQKRERLSAAAYRGFNLLKAACYAVLFCAAVYWGVKGDFVDFWDAFLWLVAFFFIERNVVEWRAECLHRVAFAA